MLVPPAAKNKKYKRQGEWFAVPIAKKFVPKIAECVATCNGELILPRESADSNAHVVGSGDIRIGKDGLIYAYAPDIDHDEHMRIICLKWVVFHINTAVRSFSQDGVD